MEQPSKPKVTSFFYHTSIYKYSILQRWICLVAYWYLMQKIHWVPFVWIHMNVFSFVYLIGCKVSLVRWHLQSIGNKWERYISKTFTLYLSHVEETSGSRRCSPSHNCFHMCYRSNTEIIKHVNYGGSVELKPRNLALW